MRSEQQIGGGKEPTLAFHDDCIAGGFGRGGGGGEGGGQIRREIASKDEWIHSQGIFRRI